MLLLTWYLQYVMVRDVVVRYTTVRDVVRDVI